MRASKGNIGVAAIRSGQRLLYIIHRWLGIGTCILFAMWFVSGIVMMYVPFPAYSDAERLADLEPIAWNEVKVDPDAAMAAAGSREFPSSLTLEMLDGQPVYRLLEDGRHLTVSATDGRLIDHVDAATAVDIVARARPDGDPALAATIERDQWTVPQGKNPYRPLYKVDVGDHAGTELYVASTTGEIVLDTTRHERVWNWFGSIPHWIYFTSLRQFPQGWRQVILWTSGIGIVGAVTGLWIGILRYRPRRRFSGGRVTPYRGWMKWHHVPGLIGGIFLLTWIFSGWLSVNPNQWFDNDGPSDAALARYYAHATADFPANPAQMAAWSEKPVRSVQFTWLTGEPMALLYGGEDGEGPIAIDAGTGGVLSFTDAELYAKARRLMPDSDIAFATRLTSEDAYWYSHSETHSLPVLRVGFNDPAQTWFYLDPATGQVVGRQNDSARTYRWMFSALHDLDFAVLLHNRPAWDIIVWSLSALGLIVSISGIVIGWRRLRKKFRPHARPSTRRRSIEPIPVSALMQSDLEGRRANGGR
jgi:uncharacterized iron-regulated membrane protein